MRPDQFHLLIHHHDVARLDGDGAIWLTAGIGRWVEALAEHFAEIGLLMHQSSAPMPRQDTPLRTGNVKLVSLGPPGHMTDRLPRMQRIRKACAAASPAFDGLLIRGITPRQHTIWKATRVAKKAFLLVGNLNDRPPPPRSLWGIIALLYRRHRLYELKQIAQGGTMLLANSPQVADDMTEWLKRRVSFVPTNTIRGDEFAPLRVRPVGSPWRLFYCGRLDPLKGLCELFQAVAALNGQGFACELDLAAELREPVYTQMSENVSKLGISEKIHWHGQMPYGARLFELYQRADAFVLPSYSEGFPRAIWEAAANCCPVIATQVGGIPALWTHEEHGLLVAPHDTRALVEAIKRLLCEESLRQKLITQAYRHAGDFTVEVCARRLVSTMAEGWNEKEEGTRF
jgi:glycosyltransferase involved in cell wall biosynthesis